jgi:RNA polymerase sigma-70 factor (ECF subfamily)
MNGTELFERCKSGSRGESLLALLRYWQDRVYTLCFQVLRQTQDAEDAAQEALVEIVEGVRRVPTAEEFEAWVYRVTLNTALDARRARRRRIAREQGSVPMVAPDRGLDEACDAVHESLARLEDDLRAVLVKHFFERRTLEDLSRETGCTTSAVWKRVEKAKEELRRLLVAAGLASLAIGLDSVLHAAEPVTAPSGLLGGPVLAKVAAASRASALGLAAAGVAAVLLVSGAATGWFGLGGSDPAERGEARDRDRKTESVRRGASKQGALLKVVSGGDRAPVAGAVVQWLCEGNFASDVTGAEGRIELAPGSRVIKITEQDHLGVFGSMEIGAGEHEVALTRCGAFELTFTGEGGAPVEGVEVELRPGMPSHLSLAVDGLMSLRFRDHENMQGRRKSGADGRILWAGLYPGRSFGFTVVSEHAVDYGPETLLTGERVKVMPEGTSFGGNGNVREFDVVSGETTRTLLRIFRPASVTGVLAPLEGAAASGVAVRLDDVREFVAGRGQGGALDREYERITDESGRFAFSGVKPGRKRVSAALSTAGGNLQCFLVGFDLREGEARDLGLLRPTGGHSVECVVRLDGETSLIVELKARGLRAVVRFFNNPIPRGETSGLLSGNLVAAIDQPFTLSGIFAGEFRLSAMGFTTDGAPGALLPDHEMAKAMMREDSSHPDVYLHKWASVVHRVPEQKSVALTIRARRRVPLTLIARAPAGGPPDRLAVLLMPSGAERNEWISERLELGPDGTGRMQCSVPSGEYEAWVHSEGLDGWSSSNYFGRATFTLAPGAPAEVRVELGAGAIVKGRALEKDGTPAKGDIVTLQTGTDRALGASFRGRSDAEGNFVVTGIAPDTELSGWPYDGKVQSGPAGSETWVELRARKPVLRLPK